MSDDKNKTKPVRTYQFKVKIQSVDLFKTSEHEITVTEMSDGTFYSHSLFLKDGGWRDSSKDNVPFVITEIEDKTKITNHLMSAIESFIPELIETVKETKIHLK